MLDIAIDGVSRTRPLVSLDRQMLDMPAVPSVIQPRGTASSISITPSESISVRLNLASRGPPPACSAQPADAVVTFRHLCRQPAVLCEGGGHHRPAQRGGNSIVSRDRTSTGQDASLWPQSQLLTQQPVHSLAQTSSSLSTPSRPATRHSALWTLRRRKKPSMPQPPSTDALFSAGPSRLAQPCLQVEESSIQTSQRSPPEQCVTDG